MCTMRFLSFVMVAALFLIGQTVSGKLTVYNDSASTIKARCLGKGQMRTKVIKPGNKVSFGCSPSFVSEGIEVEVQQNGQTKEMLQETWAPVGMIEPAGKKIVIRVREEFDAKSGTIYKIDVQK